jgi:hypothetical protein
MTDTTKPPLGLKPRWLHEEQRLAEVREALERYEGLIDPPPDEWLGEYKWLTARVAINRRNSCYTSQKQPQEPMADQQGTSTPSDPKGEVTNDRQHYVGVPVLPDELLEKWYGCRLLKVEREAAQNLIDWVADKQLQFCLEWLRRVANMPNTAERIARELRPKPLRDQALQDLEDLIPSLMGTAGVGERLSRLRHAIKSIPGEL